ncbi:hypothetical protein KW805_00925 [Candidatus Pacearchaeota archaeon]|nr:hypothetical protein [Candidatus Pacearchaeota archaeon]
MVEVLEHNGNLTSHVHRLMAIADALYDDYNEGKPVDDLERFVAINSGESQNYKHISPFAEHFTVNSAPAMDVYFETHNIYAWPPEFVPFAKTLAQVYNRLGRDKYRVITSIRAPSEAASR